MVRNSTPLTAFDDFWNLNLSLPLLSLHVIAGLGLFEYMQLAEALQAEPCWSSTTASAIRRLCRLHR